MRVALLAPHWKMKDGWSRVTENLARFLSKYVKLSLFLNVHSPRVKNPGKYEVYYSLPSLHNIFSPTSYLLLKSPSRFKLMKDLLLNVGSVDLIQTVDSWPQAIDGVWCASFLRCPLFVGAHGTYAIYPLFRQITRILLQWAFRKAVEVHCISNFTLRILKQITKLPNLTLQPLDGVDYEFFARKRDVSILRDRLGEGPNILTVAALKERKGIDICLKAFKLVKQHYPNANHIIIGRGDKTKYLDYAAKLGLKDVYFIAEVSDEELATYYQFCDLFVMTPRYSVGGVEGLGLVYLEAAAAGKPSVATRVGGVPDVVREGVNGICVPPENYFAVAETIIKLLRDEKLYNQLSEGAKTLAYNFSWENTVKSLYERWKDFAN